tara:strand:+ start:104 stop:727 length:624 start_codon:yes stop_codon:yes gene_type:complete
MATTTIDLETELSAVNSILGAIGQSPITTLEDGKKNPEVALVYNILTDANLDIQNEGWHFNTEKGVSFTPDSSGKITVTNDLLRMDVTDPWKKKQYDVVKRNGYLYDKYDHTDDWSDITSINLDVTRLFSFEDLPPVFRRYVIYRASRMAATQLVANSELTKLLSTQEGLARAACMEYECNQGNHSMFGFPEDSSYTTYQPWRALVR